MERKLGLGDDRGLRRRFRGGERVDRSRQRVLSIGYASYSYATSAPGLIILHGEGKVGPLGVVVVGLAAVFPATAAMNEARRSLFRSAGNFRTRGF